jgi:nucleotide-binding universal stress UspA family protein
MNRTPGTIVVGVDGSTSSTRALTWAIEQASVEHHAITLVHTVDIETASYSDVAFVYPQEVRDELRAEGHRTLATAHARIVEAAPGLDVNEVFGFDDPRHVLLDMSEDAAMVVVGSRGRGSVASLLLGSVGVALTRHAFCPVVVHRPSNPGAARNGILVGADATEGSRAVLEFAYRQASVRDLPLTVLHCYWDMQSPTAAAYIVPSSQADLDTERLYLGETLTGLAEKYPEVQVKIETSYGLPQQALVHRGEGMNLIVVGGHHGSAVSQMLLGSVSTTVVEHAACPVAVVPVPPAT